MKLKAGYAAVALASLAIVGCGSDSSNKNNDVKKGSSASSGYSCAANVCTLEGNIAKDLKLTADKEWRLKGVVTVGAGNKVLKTAEEVKAVKDNGVTLTIEPGVEVKAFNNGTLIITRGSKIMAEGTKASPITFSSLKDADYDGEGEWGGVIVQGFAPQYGAGNTGPCSGDDGKTICNVGGEGGIGIGRFGGTEPADNSGSMKFVRIAEGGFVAGPDDEINGLTLMGVGHGTQLEYIQVHNNLDDGIEWFGGTVNLKYAVLTNNDDDDIDFDEGYKGNIQYAIIRKHPTKKAPTGKNDPRGIEANSSDKDYVPQTEGALANITVVGSDVSKAANSKGDGKQPGMRLRGSLTARVYNTAVINFDDCVRIDDSKDVTPKDPADAKSKVSLSNVIGQCDDKFYAKRAADTTNGTVGAATVELDAAAALKSSTVVQSDFAEVDNGSGFAFDNTTYVGAVAPGTAASAAWWSGWIIKDSLKGIENQRPVVK